MLHQLVTLVCSPAARRINSLHFMFETLIRSTVGQIVALNAYHACRQEHLTRDLLTVFLTECARVFAKRKPQDPSDVIRIMIEVADDNEERYLLKRTPRPDSIEHISRVVDSRSVVYGEKQYIHPQDVTDIGLSPAHGKYDIDYFDKIKKLLENDEAILPNVYVRGRRPFAWVIPKATFNTLSPEVVSPDNIRNLLGLRNIRKGVPLIALHYPSGVMNVSRTALPTFIEAGEHYRFCPRNDSNYDDNWSRTVNMSALPNALTGQVTVDGVPEAVIEPIRFKGFSVNGLGITQSEAPDVSDEQFIKHLEPNANWNDILSTLNTLIPT